jgi:hypothetical protein
MQFNVDQSREREEKNRIWNIFYPLCNLSLTLGLVCLMRDSGRQFISSTELVVGKNHWFRWWREIVFIYKWGSWDGGVWSTTRHSPCINIPNSRFVCDGEDSERRINNQMNNAIGMNELGLRPWKIGSPSRNTIDPSSGRPVFRDFGGFRGLA